MTAKNATESIETVRLLSPASAAKYLGVSVYFLRESRRGLTRTPAPRFIRFGRSVRYDIKDLDRWIEENRQDPGFTYTPESN